MAPRIGRIRRTIGYLTYKWSDQLQCKRTLTMHRIISLYFLADEDRATEIPQPCSYYGCASCVRLYRAALWNCNLPPHERLRVRLAAGTGCSPQADVEPDSFIMQAEKAHGSKLRHGPPLEPSWCVRGVFRCRGG